MDADDDDVDTIFVAASGILGISISLNAMSTHGACTAVFVAVSSIAVFGCSSIRTLANISWLAWGGVISLTIAGKQALSLPL